MSSTVRNTSLRADIAVLLANPAWRALALAALIVYICLGQRGPVVIYYFKYVLDREDLFGTFNAVGMIATLVGIFFSTSLAERFGKRYVFCVGLLISAVFSAALYPVTGEQTAAILGLQVAYQIAFGATMPLLWGMIADVADFTEWRSGRRITALTFAATLFFFKIGQGIGTALTARLLSIVGYVPNATQNTTATEGIRVMNSLLPAVLLVAAALLILLYAITHAVEREMTAELRERREQLGLEGG